MARSVPWRRTLSDTASWRQDQGLASTVFIVREVGPTGFLLQEEGESKPFKVFLGDPHSCTCSVFRTSRGELCKHICWLLLKKFRLAREDTISWQLGLVESEINALLSGEQTRQQSIRNRPETPRKVSKNALSKDSRPVLEQREISEEDTCPICMEELLAKREPVTYCKYSCANSVHIKCMKIWAQHQASAKATSIKCPFCREDFGPAEYLREEYKNSVAIGQPRARAARHTGTRCRVCNQCPIQGKCYRCCSCNEYHLCQKCFNTPTHMNHSFEYTAVPGQRWRPAQRVVTNGLPLPSAVVSNLMARDIRDQDYDLLLQLDNSEDAEFSEIPEAVIRKFPLEMVRVGSRHLLPGEQCRVCLRSYQIGDYVRRLPCKHKFHKDCIDNWLLHQYPTCPVDGQTVWSRLSHAETESAGAIPQRIRRQNRPAQQTQQQTQNTVVEPALEIPGISIGIGRRDTQSASLDIAQVMTDIRRAHSGGPVTASSRGLIGGAVTRSSSNGASVNLAQLLLTDAIESSAITTTHEVDAERRYIASQISHTQPPDNYLASQISGLGERTVSSQINDVTFRRRAATLEGGTSVSDTESENTRRRRRNLALASRARSTNELSSAPSISTTQPVGVSSLYLGNPVIDNERITEQPMARIRNTHRQNAQQSRLQVPASRNIPNQLIIGSDSGETNLNRPRGSNNRSGLRPTRNIGHNQRRLPVTRQPNT